MQPDEVILEKSYSSKIRLLIKCPPKPLSFNLTAFDHPLNQFFDFPTTIINYILQTATSNVYEKLIKTCKYFYSKERILLVENSYIEECDPEFLLRNYTIIFLPLTVISKIWLTKILWVFSPDPYHLSKFCKKIYKCTVLRLLIFYQKLTEKEFDILTQSKFLLKIELVKSSVIKINGDVLNCEEIIEKIPKVLEIHFKDVAITRETFSKISNMPRKNLIKRFWLRFEDKSISNSYSIFDIEQFKTFIKKCAAPGIDIQIFFNCFSEERTSLKRDQDDISQFCNSMIPFNERPRILILHESPSYA